MANTENGRAGTELGALDGALEGDWLGARPVRHGTEPHQWVTHETAEAMLSALFDRHRILFAILHAEHQTGLRLRPPSGKRVADSG